MNPVLLLIPFGLAPAGLETSLDSARHEQTAVDRTAVSDQRLQRRIAAILADVEGPESVCDLTQLGSAALPVAFDSLARGRMPTADGLPLTDAQRRTLVHAIGDFPIRELNELLARAVASDDDRVRIAALLVLGAHGRSEHMELILTAVAPRAGREDPRSLGKTYEESLTAVLQRDPRGLRILQHRWPDLEPGIHAETIRAVGRAGHVEALELLTYALQRADGHKVTVLTEIARLAPMARLHVPSLLQDLLRDELIVENESCCPSAALALAKLHDLESIPLFIDLLDSDHRGVSSNAHWALCEITGLSMPRSPARWRVWYRRELTWYDEEAPAVFESLHSRKKSDVAEAVRILGSHHLFRDEIARELRALLPHQVPSIRVLAVQALTQLETPAAIAPLVDALDDADDDIRQHAWIALQSLTKRELPIESPAWREIAAEFGE